MKYNILFVAFTLFLFLTSCDSNESKLVEKDFSLSAVVQENKEEETTISIPIQEYAISISRQKEEIKQTALSEYNVKELEYWWDSLPKPLQSEIKANKVDIEVVSEIRTSNENSINADLNDSQVENTGETLEQIIGSNTAMKYTVSTTLLGANQLKGKEQHTTNIRLVKQVPVKLNSFATDIFLRQKEVDNQNIRSLQYWWTSLPQDIQDQIKTRELLVEVACHTINADLDFGVSQNLMANAKDNVAVMADVLDKLIGVYRMGKKQISIAKITTKTTTEKETVANSSLPSKQYVKINIRKNKSYIPTL